MYTNGTKRSNGVNGGGIASSDYAANAVDTRSRDTGVPDKDVTDKQYTDSESYKGIFRDPGWKPSARLAFAMDTIKTSMASLIVISLLLTVQKSKEDYRQQLKASTIGLLRVWDQDTGEKRRVIEDDLIALGYSVERLTPDIVVKIWESNLTPRDTKEKQLLYDIRNNMISLLNYGETLAVSYEQGALNEAVVRASFAPVLTRWRKRLLPFTELVDERMKTKAWEPFYLVTDRWIKQAKDLQQEVDNRKLDDLEEGRKVDATSTSRPPGVIKGLQSPDKR